MNYFTGLSWAFAITTFRFHHVQIRTSFALLSEAVAKIVKSRPWKM